MTKRAVIQMKWDEESRKSSPSMVMIFDDSEFKAVGEPGTGAEEYANHLNSLFANKTGIERKNLLSELLESLDRSKSGHGYGGSISVMDYSGSNKKRVDTMMDRLITARVERSLRQPKK